MPELPPNQPSKAWKALKAIGGVLLVFIFWSFYFSSSPQAPPVPKSSGNGRVAVREIPSLPPSRDPKEIAKNFADSMNAGRFAANEAAMTARLRTLSTAIVTYQADHSDAYPRSLGALGQAGLIDADLAGGRTGGYLYTYRLGRIVGYRIWARPETYNRTSTQSCVINESMQIHCTFEDRYATFDDPNK